MLYTVLFHELYIQISNKVKFLDKEPSPSDLLNKMNKALTDQKKKR